MRKVLREAGGRRFHRDRPMTVKDLDLLCLWMVFSVL